MTHDDWKTTAALLDGLLAGVAVDPTSDSTEPELVRKVRNLLAANARLGAHPLANERLGALEQAEAERDAAREDVKLHREEAERLQDVVADAVGMLDAARTAEARDMLLNAVAAPFSEAPLEPPATPGPVRCPRCSSDGVGCLAQVNDAGGVARSSLRCAACGGVWTCSEDEYNAVLELEIERAREADEYPSTEPAHCPKCGVAGVVDTTDEHGAIAVCPACGWREAHVEF